MARERELFIWIEHFLGSVTTPFCANDDTLCLLSTQKRGKASARCDMSSFGRIAIRHLSWPGDRRGDGLEMQLSGVEVLSTTAT